MNKFFHSVIGLGTEDYRALLDAVGQSALVSVTDAKGDIEFANDKFVEISKYTREELIGQNHRILKSGKQSKSMFDTLWQTISSGKIWRGEIQNRAKDGSYYWVDTSIAPILGKNGTPEKYVAVRFLITAKKQAEMDLERQNRAMLNVLEDLEEEKQNLVNQTNETKKFELAVESTNEHIVITDQDGIVLYANAAAERLTGYTRNEIIGTKAGVLWGGLMDSVFYRKLWETIKIQKKTFHGEIRNKRKSGGEYVSEATISPVLSDDGSVLFFIGIERDITQEKAIDQAKTEFVSLASHQLRTPLSAIGWYAEMLISGDVGVLNDEQKKYLEEIYAGNKRMVDLVNALLNVSRLELGTFMVEPKPTNVVEVAQSVLQELQPGITEREIKLNTMFGKTIPIMMADPQLLRIVFQNLLSNAVKYTPIKGSVTLSVKKDPRKDSLVIEVADTGLGIPPDEQKKIFTKLFRATNARESDTDGTGLGLYIVKAIIEQSHGTIAFTSEINKGTTFTVKLPLKGMERKEGTKSLDE